MAIKRRGLLIISALITIAFAASFASASFSIGNASHSIETKYGLGQGIIGWINISLNDESTGVFLNDSEGNSISLLNLLKLNPGANYSCLPRNCGKDYSTTNGETSKFMDTSALSRTYGLLFSGALNSIDSISLDVSAGRMTTSCTNQLKIDFFDDGIIDLSNNASSSEICPGSRSYGCYVPEAGEEEYTLSTSFPYCQKMTLPEAPGFRLGAWIRNESGKGNVIMSIWDSQGYEIEGASCNIQGAAAAGGEAYCDVNYAVDAPGTYYVCMIAGQGTGTYKIKGYIGSNTCGFFGEPIKAESAAYDIFMEAKKFGIFSSLHLKDDLGSDDSLALLAENYIRYRNGDLNCSKGCVIPVTFITNSSGYYTAGNVRADYVKESGVVTSNKLYDVSETSATANSDFEKLYLDSSGLRARSTAGNFTYKLSLDGQEIFSEMLVSQQAPVIRGLSPLKTAYAFPTSFSLDMDSTGNVSSYQWDFGDNSTATSTSNRIMHTYIEAGEYEVKIIAKDISNISSSGIFNVEVTSPGELINSTLAEMETNIANIKSRMNSYDLFYRASLNDIINPDNLSLQVTSLEARYSNANESEYNQIVSEILALKIPEEIKTTKTTPSGYVFYPQKGSINLDALKSIGQGDYGNNYNGYVDAIYAWNSENIANNMSFNEISLKYDSGTVPVLRVFELKAGEKNTLDYNSFIIIKDMENMKFKDDYGQKDSGGYSYIMLTGGTKDITFSTTESVSFDNVPMFIAPPLSELSVSQGTPEEPGAEFPVTAFIIAILILFGVAAVIYIVLQRWYRKRYEDYLFKNKNDLYNLFNFIEMQRRKGASESDIHGKLKKAGWSSEQIKYSMRKHAGKRTGMPFGKKE
jgi:PKD repeat protein